MTKELRDRLQERLKHRSERLARVAALPSSPLPILALMAEHVTATSMLLFGDEMARKLFDRVISGLRNGEGVCICGEDVNAPEQVLCVACMKEMEDLDAELDAVELANPGIFDEAES